MTIRHRDDVPKYDYKSADRVNAPTVEAAARLGVEETADQALPEGDERKKARYPRLVWDSESNGDKPTFGPLYIHDKVDPYVFVQSLFGEKDPGVAQYGFEATNGFRDESGEPAFDPNWYPYRYKGNWSNRLIKATGQRAMASLLYKENMRGMVNLIYMDPPYNISFRSNFQVNANKPETGETLDDVPRDGLAVKAFRDNYRHGIHSYLDGLREQLELARELLADDGSMIMQIGPDNLHYVALLMGEVFGMENHVATIPYTVAVNSSTKLIPEIGNWLVWHAKDKDICKYNQMFEEMDIKGKIDLMNTRASVILPDGTVRRAVAREKANPEILPDGTKWCQTTRLVSSHESSSDRSDEWFYEPEEYPDRPGYYPAHAIAYPCPTGRQWRVSLKGLHSIAAQGRMFFQANGNIEFIRYADEMPGKLITSIWTNMGAPMDKQYIVETPPSVLDRCILMTTDPGDLVLDLTCGSGAMPVAAERWGRRWIGVDVAAVSIAIARERIASTIYPNHMLKDSPEGAKLDYELEMAMLPPERKTEFASREYGFDPALGFVNERQVRVSAATLAYGPDFSKDVIRHPDRVKMSKNRHRVATAFTVETDSPYRSVRPEELDGSGVHSEGDPLRERIVESLQISGVRDEAGGLYRVENIQPCEWTPDLTHTGEMIDENGKRYRAAFYIGAEDETISRHRTNYAANASVEGFGSAEILVMVGFNRDANALQTYRHPRLRVLQVAANMDLQLSGLAAAEDDNAFVVVSEPEIRLHRRGVNGAEEIQVEAIGVTCFNPATGVIESVRGNREIMGMMVDTNYDGESFRARLMNVIRVNRNQKTLRDLHKAFRVHMDEERFATMQTNKSLPFDLPEPGVKIAVKVIDLTGMEHMAVIDDPRDSAWYA